jgi:hypothetical protein
MPTSLYIGRPSGSTDLLLATQQLWVTGPPLGKEVRVRSAHWSDNDHSTPRPWPDTAEVGHTGEAEPAAFSARYRAARSGPWRPALVKGLAVLIRRPRCMRPTSSCQRSRPWPGRHSAKGTGASTGPGTEVPDGTESSAGPCCGHLPPVPNAAAALPERAGSADEPQSSQPLSPPARHGHRQMSRAQLAGEFL